MELLFLAILVLIMAVALGSGYPVAFALPGAAILSIGLAAGAGYLFAGNMDAYFHSGGPAQWLSAGVTNLRGVYWEVERDTLIAIPLFIFMGIMLQRSKIAEDLLIAMAQLFGPVPGGLGISVVFVGALLAATTGIVGATVVAMGLISLPAMLRNNYSQSLATGTIAASGTLGQIIPPSIVLIILADQLASATDQASTLRKALHKEATGELSMPTAFDVTSTSAGEMFLGAFVPGLVLVGLYMLYILIFAIIKPSSAPSVPYDGARDSRFWVSVTFILVPPLALIFMVLGSIIAGIATVNQAGAIGAAGALIMGGYRLKETGRSTYIPALMAVAALLIITFASSNYNMNIKAILASDGDMTGIYMGAFGTGLLILALIWSAIRVFRIDDTLREVMLETSKATSLVFIILLGAAMLTAAFRAFGGEELVRDFLNSLPGGFWTQFVIVMAVIFFLGFFLDFIEIAVVVVPIVAPILLADPGANITAVWLGVMIGLNIQTSFLTPPFGFALFYLRGVAPPIVKTVQMYKGVIAFIFLQLTALGIVGYYPQLVNYLPNRVSFLSETSPPPRNPKLQHCLEEFVAEKVAADGTVLEAIRGAKALDLSPLPEDIAGDLTDAFDSAETAIAGLGEIEATHAAVMGAADDYRPQQRLVRRMEKDMRKLDEEAAEIKQRMDRTRDNEELKAELAARIEEKEAEKAAIQAQIPEDWEANYDTFHALILAEDKARSDYRRAADGSYEKAAEFVAILAQNADFAALQAPLDELRAVITDQDPEASEVIVNDLSRDFGDVEGAGDVRSALGKVRRALRARTPDKEEALEEYETALDLYAAGQAWRATAEGDIQAGVKRYMLGIQTTLGARLQEDLTREQALYLASCSSAHRDVSLSF